MGSAKIVFTGDIAFSKYYKGRENDESIIGDDVLSFLKDADHGVFNVESALSRPTNAGTFVHTSDPACAGFLKKMGGDIWNLANNHMFDAGPEGCAETIKHARKVGAHTVGAGANIDEASKPVIIESSGGIGILAATFTYPRTRATEDHAGCLSYQDTEKIRETVEKIKKTCRWCVLVLHSGREFLDIPNKEQRERYRSYLDMDIDVIVAHHPHVPQNYEKIGDKYIFYSLGNFIFDTDYQRAQAHTDEGVLLKLKFTEDALSFEAAGTKTDRATGRISLSSLPAVFRSLEDKDYAVLDPYVAARYIEHEKKRFIAVHSDKYKELGDKVWLERWEFVSKTYTDLPEFFMRASCYPDIKPGDEYKELVDYIV